MTVSESKTLQRVEGVDFVAIPVSDMAAARAFYGDVLGLTPGKTWGAEPARGAEFQAGNLTLAVVDPAMVGAPMEPIRVPIALRVDDVAAARADLEAAGIEFSMDTLDSGVCLMAMFKDPDGNQLMLHRRHDHGA